MPYKDTAIIPRRLAAKQSRALDISRTVVIRGVSYSFHREEILDGSVSVIVPERFMEMSKEAAEIKAGSS